MVFFYKILERSCFKRRRRKVANNYMSRDCTSYCLVLVIVNSLEAIRRKIVCLKLKRDVLESQINQFLCCFHPFVPTCFGPTLTLGDILVIIAYTQKPRENVDADIHVSSGDRGLNSTAIYHLHSYFTLTSLYHYTDFPESRVLVAGQCDKYQTLTYWLILI